MISQIFVGLHVNPFTALVFIAAFLIAALLILALRGDRTAAGAAATGALISLTSALGKAVEWLGRLGRGNDATQKKPWE